MEKTPLLTEFSKIVNNFNDLVKPLVNIQSFKESAFFVNDLIRQIHKFLVKENVIGVDFKVCPEGQESLREILLFLVANMDTGFRSAFPDEPLFVSLGNELPELSRNLFYILVWRLNLKEAFLELLSLAPITLLCDLMVIFPDAMQHLDKEKDLSWAVKVIVALYENFSRRRSLANETDWEIASGYCLTFMGDYFKGDREDYPNMQRNQFYIHQGQMVRHFLRISVECMKIFVNREREENCPEIYKRAFLEEVVRVDEDEIHPNIEKLNEKLLNKLQNLVDGVTVLTFCQWVEVDVEPGVTLQDAIQNVAMELDVIPKEENGLKHGVFQQIKCLIRDPKNEKQVANEATIGEVLTQLDSLTNPEQKALWMRDLMSRGELVLENRECLETIQENIKILLLEDFVNLAKFMQNSDSDNEDIIGNILLQGLSVLPIKEAVHLLTTELYYLPGHCIRKNTFRDDLRNLLASKRWSESAYLKLLAQNPRETISEMSIWVIDHEKDMKVALQLLQLTSKITENHLEEIITDLILFPTLRTTSRLLANWICRLLNCGLLRKNKILKALYYSLVEYVEKHNEKGILAIMTIFSVISQKSSFSQDAAKVLSIAGRVLDNSRWTLETYTEEIKEIARLSIVTIVETMKDFLKFSSELEKSQLKKKIAPFSLMTTFFYQKLSLNRSTPTQNFAEYLLQKESLEEVSREELEDFLSQKIIHCTSKETVWLASNEFLRPHFESVLRELAIKVSETPSAIRVSPAKCFRNCMSNYQQALEKVIIPELAGDREKVIFLHRILELFDVIPQEIYDEILQNLSTQILDLLKDVLETEECIPDCHSVLKAQVNGLRSCKLKTSLLELFND
ncbi:uncharacterized protein LOC129806112 [Phlebotomus papatasi]|uniref:uncharacterized protein LOC129806112 n=1 Tax=Phlebotomus papatasi TaxID=29031 RepID=UPI002483495F|nr:uncharacterized protein LOC129806112 [Phlebotomus papatasi]